MRRIAAEELALVTTELGDPAGHYAKARELFEQLALAEDYVDFLTVAAYQVLD